MFFLRLLFALTISYFLSLSCQAQSDHLAFTLVTDSSALNHYPGPDLLIGTDDDIVSNQPAGFGPSDPNYPGSFSYFTVRFPGSMGQLLEFSGDVIRFTTGGFEIDAVGLKGRTFGILITGGTLNGTSANPFVGRSITTLGEQFGAPDGLTTSASNTELAGIFDHSTFTPDIQSGTGIFPFPDQEILSATVVIVQKVDFGNSGDLYMDNVIIPSVSSEEITAVLRFEFEFTEIQQPDMGLDGAVIQGVLVATTTDVIPDLTGGGATPTSTFTLTLTPTETETPMLSFTLTPTETPTATDTDTPTVTETSGISETPTLTQTIVEMMTCSADLNGDGFIDFKDLLNFMEQMREFRDPPPMEP